MIALYLLALLPGVVFMLLINCSEKRWVLYTRLGRVLCYLMFVVPIFGVAEYHLATVLSETFKMQVSPITCSVITILAVAYLVLKSRLGRVF